MLRHTGLFIAAASAAIDSQPLDTSRLERFIHDQMANALIPNAAVCVVDKQRVLYQGAFGRIKGTDQPTSAATPFRIASMSKSITAFATMQLMEPGVLDLDTPLDVYLPRSFLGSSAVWHGVTARHLLNHTSGIARPEFDMGSDPADAKRIALPGEQFAYTNLNYEMLGRVISECSGMTYRDYVQEHVFDPLRMISSRVIHPVNNSQTQGPLPAYQSLLGLPVPSTEYGVTDKSAPASGIVSTAEDMGRFLRGQLNAGYTRAGCAIGRNCSGRASSAEVSRRPKAQGSFSPR